jgi:hypothetical protein
MSNAQELADFMDTVRTQAAEEVHRQLETEWLREYATHAPITYDDARQFLTSLGHPFTADDTMRMLAEMRRKYAETMLAAMKAPRFPMVHCSQCGKGFGPGDSGFSHCKDHQHLKVVED